MAKARVRTAERSTTGGPTAEPLLIRASAGTGKTYQLTGRLLRLLAEGLTDREIEILQLLVSGKTTAAVPSAIREVLAAMAPNITIGSGWPKASGYQGPFRGTSRTQTAEKPSCSARRANSSCS